MILSGKVALITGSSRGIGNSIARLFLDNGAKVVICGSKLENALEAIKKLKQDMNVSDDNVMPIGINMKDRSNIESIVKSIIDKWGKIDILVNNAGITSNVSLLDSTDQEFLEMFEVNFFGVVTLTREVVKYMKIRGGSIINTSSMVGIYGSRNQSAYASSKFAINGLTKSLARELGIYNIRVNAVAPGVVETDMMNIVTPEMKESLIKMTPLNRMANPNDLTGIYLYLASDLSKFTTGTIINVDGGLVI